MRCIPVPSQVARFIDVTLAQPQPSSRPASVRSGAS